MKVNFSMDKSIHCDTVFEPDYCIQWQLHKSLLQLVADRQMGLSTGMDLLRGVHPPSLGQKGYRGGAIFYDKAKILETKWDTVISAMR